MSFDEILSKTPPNLLTCLHLLLPNQVIVLITLIQQLELQSLLQNGTNFLRRLANPCLENRGYTRQDKRQSVAPPACTDASTTHNACNEALELSVHAGDATEHEICVDEGQPRRSVVIDAIDEGVSAEN